MGDASEAHYNHGNRAFLQSFMARGTINFEDGQNILSEIFTIQEGTTPLSANPTKNQITDIWTQDAERNQKT